MDGLQMLIGLVIDKVVQIHDYFQIVFSDGTTLNIYNYCICNDCTISSIEGDRIISVKEMDNEITLNFGGGGTLSIGMKDDDYKGPEALELLRNGEFPVIWN